MQHSQVDLNEFSNGQSSAESVVVFGVT